MYSLRDERPLLRFGNDGKNATKTYECKPLGVVPKCDSRHSNEAKHYGGYLQT